MARMARAVRWVRNAPCTVHRAHPEGLKDDGAELFQFDDQRCTQTSGNKPPRLPPAHAHTSHTSNTPTKTQAPTEWQRALLKQAAQCLSTCVSAPIKVPSPVFASEAQQPHLAYMAHKEGTTALTAEAGQPHHRTARATFIHSAMLAHARLCLPGCAHGAQHAQGMKVLLAAAQPPPRPKVVQVRGDKSPVRRRGQ
jgi:hypothetical protein